VFEQGNCNASRQDCGTMTSSRRAPACRASGVFLIREIEPDQIARRFPGDDSNPLPTCRRSPHHLTGDFVEHVSKTIDFCKRMATQAVVASSVRRPSTRRSFMRESRYGLSVSLKVPYEEALVCTTEALKAQGFGVLTTIDVKQTLKAKLDQDFRKYVILGACNPPLANRALHAELDIGLLLPCNVIVYETGPSSSTVAAMAPLAALALVGDNTTISAVASEADQRLREALNSLETADKSALAQTHR